MSPAHQRSAKLPPYDRLERLPGVGPSIAQDYRRIGITHPEQLRTEDPDELFDRLELIDGPTDPCVLYVFRCARYAVSTAHPTPKLLDWWTWKTDQQPDATAQPKPSER